MNKKLSLIVTRIVEKADDKGMVKIEADPSIDTFTYSSVLNLTAKKGEYEVGDKILLTVERV